MQLFSFRFKDFLTLMSYCASKVELRRLRLTALACLFFSVLNALSLALMPLLVGNLINSLFATQSDAWQLTKPAYLWEFLLLIIVNVSSKLLLEKLSYLILVDNISKLRSYMFEIFNYNKFANNARIAAGNFANYLLTDLDNLSRGLDLYLKQLTFAFFNIIFTLAVMLTLHVPLALLILILSPLALIITNFLSANTHKYFKLSQSLQAEQNSLITDRLNCSLHINSQDNNAYEYQYFQKNNSELKEAWHKALFFVSLSNPVNRVINNCIYIVICCIALCLLSTGNIDLAALIAFLAYTNQFSKPFSDLSSVLTELQSANTASTRIASFIKQAENEFTLQTDQQLTTQLADNNALQTILNLEHVTFAYEKDKEILHAVSLALTKGQTIALVGPSGSGKSTLINIIMRFYQPNSGSLRLYSCEAATTTLAAWRQEFAMVLQESWIFTGTLRENLLFANPDATDADLWKACSLAGLKNFITALPNGLDTPVANGHLTLSHGQKQLLALARLFLVDANIILLDEAGSAIDCYNEIKIQRSLQALRQNKSAIIVAHRLATIYQADLILVMENGKIVEAGKHQDLLSNNGLYKRLWQAQFPQNIKLN